MKRAIRRISDAERRARVVARHHLGGTAADVMDAVRCVAAMHSSDPLTPFLGVRARLRGFAVSDLERALYEDRSLLRMHAMRRTLFVVPSAEAPVFEAAASRDVAMRERRRFESWWRPRSARAAPGSSCRVRRRRSSSSWAMAWSGASGS